MSFASKEHAEWVRKGNCILVHVYKEHTLTLLLGILKGKIWGFGIMQFLKYTRFSEGSIFTETESEANPFMFCEALLTLSESSIETKRSNVERKRRLDGSKGQFL